MGGSVRDAFLGRVSPDLDFTTSARPEQTEAILADWADTHWDVGRAFGTIGALERQRWSRYRRIVRMRLRRYQPKARGRLR